MLGRASIVLELALEERATMTVMVCCVATKKMARHRGPLSTPLVRRSSKSEDWIGGGAIAPRTS